MKPQDTHTASMLVNALASLTTLLERTKSGDYFWLGCGKEPFEKNQLGVTPIAKLLRFCDNRSSNVPVARVWLVATFLGLTSGVLLERCGRATTTWPQ
jgi:hypothetical protein